MEFDSLEQERQELLKAELYSEDNFVPAKEVEPTPEEEVLVRIVL